MQRFVHSAPRHGSTEAAILPVSGTSVHLAPDVMVAPNAIGPTQCADTMDVAATDKAVHGKTCFKFQLKILLAGNAQRPA